MPGSKPDVIGQFTIPGKPIVCTLGDDLEWQAPNPTIKELLRSMFDAAAQPYCSPAMGARGRLAVADAAAWFGATPVFSDESDKPGDLVIIEVPDAGV
jgi:hypothetical protein